MPKPKYQQTSAYRAAEAEVRALREAEWNWRVRRLAALRLSWMRQVARQDIADEIKQRRLHALEIDIRQEHANLWRATPGKARWAGDKHGGDWLPEELPKHRAIDRLHAEAGVLVQQMVTLRIERRRRRLGTIPPVPRRGPDRHLGTFEIELDDLTWIGGASLDEIVSTLEKRQMSTPPRTYKPGQVPQPTYAGMPQSGMPQRGKPQSAPIPGRPTTPKNTGAATVQRALEAEIPFGKYRGETLGSLVESREGLSYLYWLYNEAEITSNRLYENIEIVYNLYQDEAEEARSGGRR